MFLLFSCMILKIYDQREPLHATVLQPVQRASMFGVRELTMLTY